MFVLRFTSDVSKISDQSILVNSLSRALRLHSLMSLLVTVSGSDFARFISTRDRIVGRWSLMSSKITLLVNFSIRLWLTNMLSMRVAVFLVMRVGLLMVG